jgi:hypothetical protein
MSSIQCSSQIDPFLKEKHIGGYINITVIHQEEINSYSSDYFIWSMTQKII